MVLVRKLHKLQAISDYQRFLLKSHVLDCNVDLLRAFKVFVVENNKEVLVDALLSFLPRAGDPSSKPDSANTDTLVRKQGTDDPPQEDVMIMRTPTLNLSYADSQILIVAVSKLSLHSMTVADLWEVFEEEAYYEGLDQTAFIRCGVKLLNSHPEPAFLGSVLDILFEVLDRDGDGVIEIGALLNG